MMFVPTHDPHRKLRRSVGEASQDGPTLVILVSVCVLAAALAAGCTWLAVQAIRHLVS